MSLSSPLLPQHVDAKLAESYQLLNELISRLIPIVHDSTEPKKTKQQVTRLIRKASKMLTRLGRLGDDGALATEVHERHGQH